MTNDGSLDVPIPTRGTITNPSVGLIVIAEVVGEAPTEKVITPNDAALNTVPEYIATPPVVLEFEAMVTCPVFAICRAAVPPTMLLSVQSL